MASASPIFPGSIPNLASSIICDISSKKESLNSVAHEGRLASLFSVLLSPLLPFFSNLFTSQHIVKTIGRRVAALADHTASGIAIGSNEDPPTLRRIILIKLSAGMWPRHDQVLF
ncbi:MAG: hypothetical protein HZB87_03010 [Desulfatitalea sp.]|nr:hypothetical protein [Desulfatitalea sp.]